MKKFLTLVISLFTSLFLLSPMVHAEDFSVPAKHAIAIEVETGKILYEKDAETSDYVGTLSKLVTYYLVYEAIREGKISLDTPVEISDYPFNLTLDTSVTNAILDTRKYTVRDLLYTSIIGSANNSTIALAEKIAGSEPAFVDMMKKKLQEWNISDASLVNSTGLNNSFLGEHLYPNSQKDDENKMSAKDLAIVARRLITDYPQILKTSSQTSFTLEGQTYNNSNTMLKTGLYERGGVDGLKTGDSERFGSSFVATTEQAGMRIITVVLNADDGANSPDNKFIATNRLMDYVYNTFALETLVEKGKQYNSSNVPVFDGEKATSPAVANKSLQAVVVKGTQKTVVAHFKSNKKSFNAPLYEGQKLGTLTLEDKNLIGKGYVDQLPQVEMIVPKDMGHPIAPISWWNHFVRYVNEKL